MRMCAKHKQYVYPDALQHKQEHNNNMIAKKSPTSVIAPRAYTGTHVPVPANTCTHLDQCLLPLPSCCFVYGLGLQLKLMLCLNYTFRPPPPPEMMEKT